MIAMLAATWPMSVLAMQGTSPPQGKRLNMQVHGNAQGSSNIKLLDVLKNQKLEHYSAVTIGKAFDNYKYFSKVAWKESPATNGKIYFDCTGMIKKKMFTLDKSWDDVAFREVEVKFVVNPSGEYGVVMATRIDMKKDGQVVRLPLADLKGLLNSIYANKEISF
jgi:hypothetical protein